VISDWYPDWSGRAAAIIASGPSAKKADIGSLRGKMPVLAIKENVELAPWADVVYGCDAAWWKFRAGLPKYTGIKVTWDGASLPGYQINRVALDRSQDRIYPVERRQYRMLFDTPGVIGGGGNSGFQAVNLAAQFGATKLLLIGFDMHDRSGVHWYGRNGWNGGGNPDESCFGRWRRDFDRAAIDLEMRGVEVINVAPHTALTCFRRATIDQALAGWGL
jgi:hypothetical protein